MPDQKARRQPQVRHSLQLPQTTKRSMLDPMSHISFGVLLQYRLKRIKYHINSSIPIGMNPYLPASVMSFFYGCLELGESVVGLTVAPFRDCVGLVEVRRAALGAAICPTFYAVDPQTLVFGIWHQFALLPSLPVSRNQIPRIPDKRVFFIEDRVQNGKICFGIDEAYATVVKRSTSF